MALLLLSITASAQVLPDKIRGYKVHKESIVIRPGNESPGAEVTPGEPKAFDLSLTGLRLEIPVEFAISGQSGKVDMLTFHDVRVNGIPVNVEEHSVPFEFKKNEKRSLPNPLSIIVPTHRMIQAAVNESRDSRETWIVTGRAFVFGKFRKFGFHHKRVVPVDIEFEIPNPLL
ncbi:MAG TPA: hypothetical protein VK918_02675 [Pyrinomonadaceae bacterium]|nr:hypothetical protein [Pyrinomonadaceae bacterium]